MNVPTPPGMGVLVETTGVLIPSNRIAAVAANAFASLNKLAPGRIDFGVGTGFIGLTTRRVIIQDKSFAGKRVAITSIPYSKVSSVSVVSNKSWAGQYFSTGIIAITVGQHVYEVEFRGSEKTHHVHNVILHYSS